jgi:two-component system NtrC family sensor kinase
MRLYQQLVLFMLAATVLPLAGVGFWLLGSSERALVDRIAREQVADAQAQAERSATSLMGPVDALGRAAEAIDWLRATPEERKGGLSLLYQQSPLVAATVLVDAGGKVVDGPVFAEDGSEHPRFSAAGVAPLVAAVPVEPLRDGARGQVALSPAFVGPDGHAAFALAIKLADGREAPFAFAEVGLARLEGQLAQGRGAGQGRLLVDGAGRVLASSDKRTPLGAVDPSIWSQVRSASEPARAFAVAGAHPVRAAFARLEGELGLFSLVTADETLALRPVATMRQTVLFGVGVSLCVLLALGALFTRRLTGRLSKVVDGVDAFGKGELSRRIALPGADELSELADAFNRMGGELETSRAKLLRWNDDLRQKVDEATAELRAAQVQLLETQKLAAVGQLGAGVAHEINNPLAGILGHTQLLMLERESNDPDFEALKKIEQSAKRCRDITQNLLRFSQQREKAELRPCDLNAVVRDALSMSENQIKGEGVDLVYELSSEPVKVSGDPGHLTQLILAFVSNARTAMAKSASKKLTVRTLAGEDAQIAVLDTGKGIAPEHLGRIFEPFFTTKDVWSNVGLGLSVAFRIASEHKGKIEVATEVGKGSTFTLHLPLAQQPSVPAAKVA